LSEAKRANADESATASDVVRLYESLSSIKDSVLQNALNYTIAEAEKRGERVNLYSPESLSALGQARIAAGNALSDDVSVVDKIATLTNLQNKIEELEFISTGNSGNNTGNTGNGGENQQGGGNGGGGILGDDAVLYIIIANAAAVVLFVVALVFITRTDKYKARRIRKKESKG
jgi:hypothetical protein